MNTSSDSPGAPSAPQSPQPTASFVHDRFAIEKVLVPLDFTDEALPAVQYAAPLAKEFGAAIHLVYVGENYFSEISLTPPVFSEPELIKRMRALVQERTGIDIPAENCHARTGRPFHEITAMAVEIGAGLVVLSTHTGRGFEHLLRGSTAGKVVRHSRVPVLVVEPGNKPRTDAATGRFGMRKILVPVDFSACAREGANYAASFARKVGAELLLLHVIEPPNLMRADAVVQSTVWPQLEQETEREARARLQQLLDSLGLGDVNATSEVAIGSPAAELARQTERDDVDMVITSTHGHTGLQHLLLGSVAEQLIRDAKCPVLVVPSHTD